MTVVESSTRAVTGPSHQIGCCAGVAEAGPSKVPASSARPASVTQVNQTRCCGLTVVAGQLAR